MKIGPEIIFGEERYALIYVKLEVRNPSSSVEPNQCDNCMDLLIRQGIFRKYLFSIKVNKARTSVLKQDGPFYFSLDGMANARWRYEIFGSFISQSLIATY